MTGRNRNHRRSLALLLGYGLAALILLAGAGAILQMLGLFTLLSPAKGGPAQTYLQGGEVRSMQVQVQGDLIVRQGDQLSVTAQNAGDRFRCDLSDGLLTISDTNSPSWLFHWRGLRQQVVVTLPEGTLLEEAMLAAGAGDLQIDSLDAQRLTLEAGVGDAQCFQLNAWESAHIVAGVGDVEILSGQLQNLNLEGGVGDFDCAAALLGQCTLEAGVGDIELTILGSRQDYFIQADKGLGDLEIDDEDLKGGPYGDPAAPNTLQIRSGVGDLEIAFAG